MLDLLRLMRVHQWVKNAFVFTGILFGHAWKDPDLVFSACQLALGFSLVASSVYVFNDIMDREKDGLHPKKRERPIASGRVPLARAAFFGLILLAIGLGLSFKTGKMAGSIVLVYALMNLGYSLGLKRVVILDVFIIATGFMLRIMVGTYGVGIPPSKWLLLCGLMITLFLGFAKRRSEMLVLAEDKGSHRKVLDHYSEGILDQMMGITAASAIMTYSLYTMDPDTVRIHQTDDLIATVPFVIYGIFRYLYLMHHRHGGGDPSKELLRDAHLRSCVVAWLMVVLWLIT